MVGVKRAEEEPNLEENEDQAKKPKVLLNKDYKNLCKET